MIGLIETRSRKALGKEWAASLAEYILLNVLPQNREGFTLDARRRKLSQFTAGSFIVSLKNHGRILKRPPSHRELSSWILENSSLLMRIGHYIGYWHSTEDGLLYLDISVSKRGIRRAIRFAQENQQISIYDVAEERSIPVLIQK